MGIEGRGRQYVADRLGGTIRCRVRERRKHSARCPVLGEWLYSVEVGNKRRSISEEYELTSWRDLWGIWTDVFWQTLVNVGLKGGAECRTV